AHDVPAAVLMRARHVHVSSYFLVADSLGPGLAALLEAARACGAGTSLDTNWDPAQRWRDERLTAALAHVNLLLPNEAEALHLAGGVLGLPGGPPGLPGGAPGLPGGAPGLPGGAPGLGGAVTLEQAVSALTA